VTGIGYGPGADIGARMDSHPLRLFIRCRRVGPNSGEPVSMMLYAGSREGREARVPARTDIPPAREEGLFRSARRCTLFASLPMKDLRTIVARGYERRLDKRATAFRQGDRADTVYLLLQGRLKLLITGPSGRLIVLAFVGPGEAFGYIAPMAETAHVYTAQALEDSRVIAWPAKVFEDVVGRYPRVARNLLRIIARRLQADSSRLHELVTEPVARRLARAVLRLALSSGSRRAPAVALMQQDLAELLGTTPPTLSRILGRWEKQGLVLAGRERIVVTNPDGLAAIA
jgi:CRP-like cAMP-binding protein